MTKRWHHRLRSERQPPFICPVQCPPISEAAATAREAASRYILRLYHEHSDYQELNALCVHSCSGFFCIEHETLLFPVPDAAGLPVLPVGYGYKGGAARYLLRRALGRTGCLPRDLDIVRRGANAREEDRRVAEQYMKRDFKRGHGVELIHDLRRYFDSRDLTINELIFLDGMVRCTLLCFLDTLGCLLRPAFYRGGTLHREPSVQGKIVLKMLRLQAEGLLREEPWVPVGIPEAVSINCFDLAVELNKAFECGAETAEKFITLCRSAALLGEQQTKMSLIELTADLAGGLFGGADFFDALSPELAMEVRKIAPYFLGRDF